MWEQEFSLKMINKILSKLIFRTTIWHMKLNQMKKWLPNIQIFLSIVFQKRNLNIHFYIKWYSNNADKGSTFFSKIFSLYKKAIQLIQKCLIREIVLKPAYFLPNNLDKKR